MKLDIDFGLFPDIECEVAGERIKYSIFNDYSQNICPDFAQNFS